MRDIPLEQAIVLADGPRVFEVVARSPGFLEEWRPEALGLCGGFGERPPGIACPSSVFAHSFGPREVTVVQVADLPNGKTLAFRLLILPRPAYARWIGDPFVIADSFPPSWDSCGELPALRWPAAPVPQRTVEQVRRVLKRTDSPTLLGGAQALVDGARLVFVRSAPDPEIVRCLWALLPASTRAELWPATFAFGNALGFDLVVLPSAQNQEVRLYLTESQAGDYPEGRYEHGVQAAAEAGDQEELDRLFARRSRAATLRLVLVLLGVLAILAAGMRWLTTAPQSSRALPAMRHPVPAQR